VAELKLLLEKAEEKTKQLQVRIKVLSKQITDMGGKVLQEKELEKLELELEA